MKHILIISIVGLLVLTSCQHRRLESWKIDSQQEWEESVAEVDSLDIKGGTAMPIGGSGIYRSKVHTFQNKRKASGIVFRQSPAWLNWTAVEPVGPTNLRDAPVFLTIAPGNYWMFGRFGPSPRADGFQADDVDLGGYDIPLRTTPFKNQFDAPGGLKEGLGGYHAWQSRDLVNWVHHGSVTEEFSRWVTTAEHVAGKTYIYYDYPNDQDPHLYIDEDLTDGKPGQDMGLAFRDPTNGSDCTFIRSLDGKFHVFYEDWSPIDARKHSWDSPLAGHAVSDDGIGHFKILEPAIDERTQPTGEFAEYPHPHWLEHPDWNSNIALYEIHEPEQNAYGDWAAISIGGQYYLFGDFHPASKPKNEMSVAWFTAPSIDEPFRFCGHIGQGHPDPDIAFAEGQFYLVTQTQTDFVSPGPWVEQVEARVGVDTSKDGKVNLWTDWKTVKEHYELLPGFSKQVARNPASIDLRELPVGFGFCFEFRLTDTTTNVSVPELDAVALHFEQTE